MIPLRKVHLDTIWTCYANVWLGFWLLFSYRALGYNGSLAWSDSISGMLLILFGLCSISYRHLWAPWAIAFIGVWLQFAPLVFWTHSPAAYLNGTMIGALAIACSILIPGMPGRLPDSGPTIPPNWSYNPSSWIQRFPILILATIGWFISRYLAAYELGFIDTVWDPVFGDGTLRVITSKVSHDFPIPDAGLGAMAYTLEALLALKGGENRWRTMPWMVVLFGLLVVPLGLASITLIILQPLVVGAWCFLCLCTAFCMTVMVALAIDEVAAVLQFMHKQLHAGQKFWDLFWKGAPCPAATQDTSTPQLDEGPISLLKAACRGVSIPWNLLVSTLLGAGLMLCPWFWGFHYDADYILGAFVVVVSVISTAEIIRKARFLNLLLGAALIVALFTTHKDIPAAATITELLMAAALIALSFRNGLKTKTY